MRDWIYATALAIAAGLVVAGIAEYSTGAALIAAGILLAGWATLVIVVGDAGAPAAPATLELDRRPPVYGAIDEDAA